MGKKWKKWVRKHKGLTATITIVGILLVSYVIYGGVTGNWLLWWQTPAAETPAPAQITFQFLGRDTGDNLTGASLEVYGNDTNGLSLSEVNAREADSFLDLGANVSGEGFTPVDLWDYVGVLTCPGYCMQEFIIDTSVTGTYTIYMDPVGTNASILAVSSTLKTNLKVNSVANTTETDWDLIIQPLDDGGLANDSLAFNPYCSFMEGGIAYSDFTTFTNWFLVELTLNCTADPTWLTVNSPDATVDNSTTHLFILVNVKVLGRTTISITFDAGIDTDFKVNSAITAFGTESAYTPLGALA